MVNAPEDACAIKAASRRAYRDLARTLRGFGSYNGRKETLDKVTESLVQFVQGLDGREGQEKFDQLRVAWCEDAIRIFESTGSGGGFPLTYGQAQKWINMTLKYLAVLGHEQVNQVYKMLHVPIDSVVFDEAKKIRMTRSRQRAWLKLAKEEYMGYQQVLRKAVAERFGEDYPPLDWETKAWATRGEG